MSEPAPPPGYRSGFIAVVGRANTGKSSLVNRLVGTKVAITSPIPFTTRSRVQGIHSVPHAQLIVADTPAVHLPRDLLGTRMVQATAQAVADRDVRVWVVDAARDLNDEDEQVASLLQTAPGPVVVALSKADRANEAQIAALAGRVSALATIHATLPVSAVTGLNVDRFRELLVPLLPIGPQYFPVTMRTDQPETFFIAELIREQAFAVTRAEVPHALAVQIDELTPRAGQNLLYVHGVILVERASHKKIIIGRGGQLLKRIGEAARKEIERERDVRVYLELWVKVSPKWRDRLDLVRALYPD